MTRWTDDSWEIEAGVVRPYLLTQGRTNAGDGRLVVEALVETTLLGQGALRNLRPELRDIVDLCRAPRSVAEVAAHIGVPLGVVRVLVADLAGARLVQVHHPSPDVVADIDALQRMIARVKAIPV